MAKNKATTESNSISHNMSAIICMPSCSSTSSTNNNTTGSKQCACCGRLVASDENSKCESSKHKTNGNGGKCEASMHVNLQSPIDASNEVKSCQKAKIKRNQEKRTNM